MACAKRHLRIDGDAVFGLWHVGVECAGYHTTSVDNEGFEIVLLPFLVPVLVFGLLHGVGYFNIGQGECGQCLVEGGLVEECLLNVALEVVLVQFLLKGGVLGIGAMCHGRAVEFVGMYKTVGGRPGGKGKF